MLTDGTRVRKSYHKGWKFEPQLSDLFAHSNLCWSRQARIIVGLLYWILSKFITFYQINVQVVMLYVFREYLTLSWQNMKLVFSAWAERNCNVLYTFCKREFTVHIYHKSGQHSVKPAHFHSLWIQFEWIWLQLIFYTTVGVKISLVLLAVYSKTIHQSLGICKPRLCDFGGIQGTYFYQSPHISQSCEVLRQPLSVMWLR